MMLSASQLPSTRLGDVSHMSLSRNWKRRGHLITAYGKKTEFDLIVSDIDGTLLNSQQCLSQKNLNSILASKDLLGVDFMVATGKAIGRWTAEILPPLQSRMPEIFIQGLYIRDPEGRTVFSNSLSREILQTLLEISNDLGITMVLYSHNRIICRERNELTDRLIFYGEPTPEAVGSVDAFLEESRMEIYKVIYMSHDARLGTVLKPKLREIFGEDVSITSAIEGMLEVLPKGSSKGKGVEFVLDMLNVAPERVMAIGDGENDIEMLQLVGLGIAVANATEATKAAADVVSQFTNDEDAVAHSIEEYILLENAHLGT